MKTHEQAREKAEVRANSVCRDYWATPMKDEGEAQRFLAMKLTTAILDAQKEAVKEAADIIALIPTMAGHQVHWDETLQRGAGCPKCIEQRPIIERARHFLTTYEQRNDEGREG